MNNNLISIIIPCYNQASFLGETLQCIYNQEYINWECLLIDDGSTDNTALVIEKWTNNDVRYKYFKKVNTGVSDTRNFGLAKANGHYIQFLDADDLIESNKLKISVDSILKENLDVVCTNYQMLSEQGKYSPPFSQLNQYEFTFENIVKYWNNGFTVPIHCWFFTKDIIWDLRFPVGLNAQEDWVLWIKVFKKNPVVKFINHPLAIYRIHSSSRTQNGDFFNETLQAIHLLKKDLDENQFRLLYESVLIRYKAGSEYWHCRTHILKKSRTYRSGYILKMFFQKNKCLHLATKIFDYLLKLKV